MEWKKDVLNHHLLDGTEYSYICLSHLIKAKNFIPFSIPREDISPCVLLLPVHIDRFTVALIVEVLVGTKTY